MTVKVTPQPGIARDHHIVCVVEVKRNNDTEAKAEEQMEAYMEQAANLPRGCSVRICDGNVDNIETLYRLRRVSGRPADYT